LQSLPRDENKFAGEAVSAQPATVIQNTNVALKQPGKKDEQKNTQTEKIKKPEPKKVPVRPKPIAPVKKTAATSSTNDY
jgi:hypothetical protein